MLDVTTLEGWHWMLFKRFNDFVALDKEVSTKKKKEEYYFIFLFILFLVTKILFKYSKSSKKIFSN